MADPLGGILKISIKVTYQRLPWIDRFLLTLKNRLSRCRRARRAIAKACPEIDSDYIGKLGSGRYKTILEPSFSIELFGQSSRQLDLAAAELAKEFSQISVLVLDLNLGESRHVYGPPPKGVF